MNPRPPNLAPARPDSRTESTPAGNPWAAPSAGYEAAPPDTTDKFRVVLLYDRLASANRAMTTYAHLARALEDDFKPDLRVWRLDASASPGEIERFNADIAAAELVVVAVGADQPCPPAFQHWRDHRRVAPHGIVALVESESSVGAPEPTWAEVLHGIATEIHPGVFVCEVPATTEEARESAATTAAAGMI